MKKRYVDLRPFSHTFGSACLIPGSSFVVQAFASKFVIFDLNDSDKKIIKEQHFSISKPLKQFTLLQDLERNCVTCFSEAYRIHITPTLAFVEKKNMPKIQSERLCLGVYKKQEIERIRTRLNLCEIFPLLFRLGMQSPHDERKEERGVFSLLQECKKIERPEMIYSAFEALYLAGFSPFFVPRDKDIDLHNLYEPLSTDIPITALLSYTARWIRSLFFQDEETSLHFLPFLPPQCASGKMFDLQTEKGIVNFAWSKKEIRMVHLHCTKSGSIELCFSPSIKQYRVRDDLKKRGFLLKRGERLEVLAGQSYWLDRFEK